MTSMRLGILDAGQIEEIHGRTLELLQQTGIRVELKRMRQLLADQGCIVDAASRVVRFPAPVVERLLQTVPRQFTLYGADPQRQWTISPDSRVWAGLGTAFRMLDTRTGERREAAQEDLRKHLVLFDHLPNVSCNQMDIWAQDVAMHTVHVEAIRTWAHNCTKTIGMGAYGVMATTDMMAMVAMVRGGKEKMRALPPFCAIVSIESPLSSSQIQLEGLMVMAEHHMPAIMAPEAMAGTTAPVTLAGLLLQQNAEILAHIIMAQAVSPGTPVLYGTVSTIAEMRRGTAALGAIETGMISAAAAQLAHYYGIPIRAVAGATEAKDIDIQCGVERSQSMLLAALGGANYITCVGTLESTNLGAHELAVIDDEIIGRVERVLRGIDVDPTTLAEEVIRSVGPGGNYLMEAHTQQHFRTEHFLPRVTDRDQADVWEKGGRRNMLDHAREAMEKILEDHRPRPLDPGLAAELDAYVAMVEKRTVDDFKAAEWEA